MKDGRLVQGEDYLFRVSSTSLTTFLDCPRKWIYNHFSRPESFVVSYPMAVGTLFHAIQEWRMTHNGQTPSLNRVKLMDGNYDPPSQALVDHPSAWEEAVEMARVYPPDRWFDECPLDPEHRVIEASVDDWSIISRPDLGGVLLGGYIDVLDRHLFRISDWKTRGGFRYAPETFQEFLDDVQLCYYAALAARQYEWPYAVVRHLNVQRTSKGKASEEALHEIPRWFLDGVLDTIEQEVIPQMIEAYKTYSEEGSAYVTRNSAACFKYGGCPHRTECPAQRFVGDSLLDRMRRTAERVGEKK